MPVCLLYRLTRNILPEAPPPPPHLQNISRAMAYSYQQQDEEDEDLSLGFEDLDDRGPPRSRRGYVIAVLSALAIGVVTFLAGPGGMYLLFSALPVCWACPRIPRLPRPRSHLPPSPLLRPLGSHRSCIVGVSLIRRRQRPTNTHTRVPRKSFTKHN